MGRVLRPGGWALFQLSTDPSVHVAGGGVRERVAGLTGRGPRGREAPEWIGSAVEVEDLRTTADEAGLEIDKLLEAGSQYTTVYCRRR